jgi:DNA polymerase III delta prime subunit
VKHFWVKGVLEKSLHEQVLITLGMEERPDAIERPWNLIVETEGSERELPANTSILSVFDELGAGRTLLILGEPGSGKTITLLQLARDLIARAEQDVDYLIPVVVNLSSWTPTRRRGRRTAPQSIADWVVEELSSKYQVPRHLGKDWVKKQQLLLLLDGLDEVKAADRDACVNALNAFQQEASTELVVCCRARDYEALSNRLQVQQAIYIQPLTLPQIKGYLNRLTANLTGLIRLLATDSALPDLAQSPLLLNIMVFAYGGVIVADLPQTLVIADRRRQLFNTYIQQMLKHRGQALKYPQERFLGWLRWLALQMVRESQTVFLIERMQPYLLPFGDQRIYRVGSLLLLALVCGLIFALILGSMNYLIFGLFGRLIDRLTGGLISMVIDRLIFGLIFGLFVGLSCGLFFGMREEIRAIEKLRLKWSWQEARSGLNGGLIFGLILGLTFGLSGMLNGSLIVGLFFGLFFGLFLGLTFGLIGGLTGGLIGIELEKTTMPNQGIWSSVKNFASVSLISGLIVGLIVGLIDGLHDDLHGGLIVGLTFGLFFGLIGGLFFGGAASIQHLTLRLILYFNGHIPWNYARFLDTAADRLFLQKVGGGYIFIHRLLMEHIAQLPPE